MHPAVIALGNPVDVAHLRWQWAQEDAPENQPSQRPSPEFVSQVASWMRLRTVWTAHRREQAVGMVCLTEHERMPSPHPRAAASWGYLGHLYVLPTARGDGIGAALIQALLGEAARRHYAKVLLSPSELSIPLYQRSGFTNAHTTMMWKPSTRPHAR